MSILKLLPATMPELAAMLGCTLHQVNARLDYWKRRGYVKRSDRKVPNRNTKQGAHNSALWLRVR